MKHVVETPDAYHHRSAGGVVVDTPGPDALVVMLHRTNGEWTLPKGHLEDEETSKEAAIREIAEETGLDRLEILFDLDTVRYVFQQPDGPKPHHKEVVFYLVLSSGGQLPLSPEAGPKFDDARWLTFPEAEDACTYEAFRTVLCCARSHLRKLSPR